MQQKPPFDLNDFRPPRVPRQWFRLGIPIFLVLILLGTSVYTIGPEEVGVVLRFGKFVRTEGPGLNFKLPFGVETYERVAVQRQLKEEFGFRTVQANARNQFARAGSLEESLMLTGDLNAAEVKWIAQYRIKDPFKYLFRVRNPADTFRDLNEAIMREIIGDRTINEVITIGRKEIEDAVKLKLQDACDQYELGINVDQLVLQDVDPPTEVRQAFNEVNQAQQEKEKLINQAQADYNKIIPKARGEAERTIEEAKGYAIERVNNARGDVARFNALFLEYQKAKEVTRQRIYLETLNNVLPKIGRKLITDDQASGILPLFNLQQQGGQQK